MGHPPRRGGDEGGWSSGRSQQQQQQALLHYDVTSIVYSRDDTIATCCKLHSGEFCCCIHTGKRKTDSAIAPPPKNQRFCLTNVSWLLDTRKDTVEAEVPIHFLVCKGLAKGLSIDDVGVSRDTVFQDIPPGAGLQTGDPVEEKLGGLS